MKRERFNKLIHLFDSLPVATGLVYNDIHRIKNKLAPEPGTDKEQEKLLIIMKTSLGEMIFLSGMDDPLLNEIEDNLFHILQADRIIYIQGILRRFIIIAPFFNSNFISAENPVRHIQNKCSDLLSEEGDYFDLLEASLSSDSDILTIAKRYLIYVSDLYFDFFLLLDALCLTFNISIIKIQKELKIQVYTQDDVSRSMLIRMGYEVSLVQPDQKLIVSYDNQKLSLSQIALKRVWEEEPITKENSSEIALMYGYKNGLSLYNTYCKLCKKSYRIATSDLSRKQLSNKINLFESVIELLSESKKKNVLSELDHLKNALIEDY